MNKKELEKARKKIDKIDNSIFSLVKQRTKVVKYMLSLKKYKNQIVDRKRINEILKIIRNKSRRNNVDVRITNRIWKAMIWSYIEYQKRNFKR